MKVLGLVRKSSILILVLGILAPSSQAATTPDEQFVGQPPSDVRSVPYFGFSANGLGNFSANQNFLLGKVADGPELNKSKVTEVGICRSMLDNVCSRAQVVSYRATLGFCTQESSVDCIESLIATKNDGTTLDIVKGETFPGARSGDFTGDSKLGLPSGGSAPIVSIPQLRHSGGDKYLILVTASGNKLPGESSFSAPNLDASIYATKIDLQSYSPPGIQTDLKWYDKLNLGIDGWSSPNRSCPIYGLSGCTQRHELAIEARFALKIKLSKPVKGWLHGRINNVKSEVRIDKNGYQEVTVEGTPLILPTVYAWAKKATAPKSILELYDSFPKPLGGGGYGCLDDLGSETCGARPADQWVSVMRDATPTYSSMQEFLAWLPAVGDKATTAPTMWSFATVPSEGADESCYQDSGNLSGFVATNATQYLAGPPVFNKQEQTLDYKVAAPHYLPNGNEFLGTYDLQIRSEVARCLYGFTDAPISASISVTSADGKEKVATTELVQKDGWLNFSAKGFTFSNPTIRVKLTQKVETPQPQTQNNQGSTAVSTEQAAATPKPASIKMKKSITCIKGVKTRKVVGTNPKCPAGYKKRG